MQLVEKIPAIYSGEPSMRFHRCGEHCEYRCDCGRHLCLDAGIVNQVDDEILCLTCFMAEMDRPEECA